jgi:PAS domain S-box-containing protein
MPDNLFAELKRYMRFGAEDEAALRAFLPQVEPHFAAITETFYERIQSHPSAFSVLHNEAQLARLKGTLREWLHLLFCGPWDAEYYERRARIGRVHVKTALPQRYMFGAMDVIRVELTGLLEQKLAPGEARDKLLRAVNKILDLELAIMLESYQHAVVDDLQRVEREQRADLVRQLALSEARYDEIVEKAEALISTTDHEGHILLFNAKSEQVTGLARGQAKGRHWLDVFVQDSERAEVARLHQEVMCGRPANSYEGPVRADAQTRRVRWHFTTLPGGASPALCAIGIDVTNEYDLSVRTRRAERLAALGTMAAGLAHEIRNPLNSANLQLNVARRRLARGKASEGSHAIKAVDLAESEMKRLASLVQDFLQFASPQPLRLAFVDLRATAELMLAFLMPEAKAAGVTLQLAAGQPVELELDDEKVKQVLLNLLRNAIEATGRSGHVTVRVSGAAGATALLTIEDDGPGWPVETPIFEPFFTTKDQGTGLGLAIVHRIVMDHGGSVDADSRPGKTTFSIRLPRARKDARAAQR